MTLIDVTLTGMCDTAVMCLVCQRAELAALRAKRKQEEEMKRAQAKRDKLFVACLMSLLQSFTTRI